MNYQEFRDLWHKALKAARLQIPYPIGPTEKVDLSDMSRSYELILYGGSHPKAILFSLPQPSHGTGMPCFRRATQQPKRTC